MKKIALLVPILILCQSCHSYKATAVNNFQIEKPYVMLVNNETLVRGRCHSISNDSIEFRVKNRLLKYSKNDISHVKRKKVSALKSVGVFAALTSAAVLSITTNNTRYPYHID